MHTLSLVLFILGLVLLLGGAESLVRGAGRLAASVGVSPLVIGLTIVAYGTSAPELAVSVQAGWNQQADLALGNVVGSNIFNVLFILGISAAITPLAVALQLLRFDLWIMLITAIAVLGLGLNGRIGWPEGAALLAGGLAYTAWLVRAGRRAAVADVAALPEQPTPPRRGAWLIDILQILIGLVLLVVGARWLVAGAIEIARALGLSELVIGLTIVAAGTSLPEVATSIVAAVRGQRDIAVGNIVGSNIFNVLIVLGAAAMATPGGVSVSTTALRFDVPVMVAISAACLPIAFTGQRIARWEGVLFLGYYAAYVAYLILAARSHRLLPEYEAVMRWGALPITVVALAATTWLHVRQTRRARLG